MRIEAVNTGTELLLGKVVNTHASFFGEQLFKLGLRLQRQTAIPDGDDIREVLSDSFPRCDVILVTGGLGPTSDDVTREVAADLMGRELILDSTILDGIREMFVSRGLKPTSSNDRQAMVPQGAEILENPNGTAPGLYFPAAEKNPHLFLLPGPPRELRPMWESDVFPKIADLRASDEVPEMFRNFRIYGVGESAIATFLEPKTKALGEDLELGYCARLGEVDVRLIGTSDAVEAASKILRKKFKEKVVTESEHSISRVLIDLLEERKETVATAESCTGGLIASTLTDEGGSSAVFQQGFVTYSNEAKAGLLGVEPEIIQKHGAVSEETVRAMAEGCLRVSKSDYAISVSGIAGPTGGTEEKPVGTVFIGIASARGGTTAEKWFWPAERVAFKTRVCRLALDLLRRRILSEEGD